jgi:large subunit ribosomal protein L24
VVTVKLFHWHQKFSNMTIKTGDTVTILSGKDKGKSGTVMRAQDGRVVVEGLGMITKHLKPRNNRGKGGIVTLPTWMPRSKVMVICPQCQKATRGRHTTTENATYRSCTACAASLEK